MTRTTSIEKANLRDAKRDKVLGVSTVSNFARALECTRITLPGTRYIITSTLDIVTNEGWSDSITLTY